MEDNNFLGDFVGGDAPDEQDEDLSAPDERDSDPYGGSWADLPPANNSVFHGTAAMGHQQPFAPTEGHLSRQGSFNMQNSQMRNIYGDQEINASNAMLSLGQNGGNNGLYGVPIMAPSGDQEFQYGNIYDNMFSPFGTSDLGHPGSGFTHHPSFERFTGTSTHAHGRNDHRQSLAITGPSYSPAGIAHNPYQRPSQSHFPASSMGHAPGPAFPMLPAEPNLQSSTLPYSGGDARSTNSVPSNDHKHHPWPENNSFTLPDSGFSHYITPNPHIGRVGFRQAVSMIDKEIPGRRRKPKPKSKKVSRSKKKGPSTNSATSSPQEDYSYQSGSGEASEDSDRVKKSSAVKLADNEEESEYEDAPPKKTRKTRKAKPRAAVAKDSVVVPTLRMANDEITDLLYLKGAGIREPLQEKNESGLFFETYDESRDGVAKLNWMPPQNDATVPKNEAELRPHVMNLREAMKDMSAYIGRPGSKMKNRWLPANWKEGDEPKEGDVLQNPYYPEMWLERRAWDIAKSCQRLHLEGPGFINCLDPLLLETSFEFKDLTFAERMDRLVAACRHCKDRVAAMLKLGMGAIYQYLLAPEDLVKASKGNRANNDIRQTRLKESATKRKRGEEEEEEEEEEEN